MYEQNRGEVAPYDWTVEPTHEPALTAFERAWEHGRHVHVAVDYLDDFPTLVATAASVAEFTDGHGDTVYAVGLGDGQDDHGCLYSDRATAWLAAVELARTLAEQTPWDKAADSRVPARSYTAQAGANAA